MPAPERAPAALLPRAARVLAVRQETRDTWTLELEGQGSFAPGQFFMLWAYGVGEVPISVSGHPDEPARLVHTIRAVGHTTRALCALRPGDELGVRGPFGRPWPVERALGQDLVLVAGGIGLAPLRPALRWALARRGRLRRVVLLAGSRTPEDLLYREELAALQAGGQVEVRLTVDATGPGVWAGDVGLVTRLLGRADYDPARAVALVCGPGVMMRFTAQGLIERGVPPGEVWVSEERNMHCAVAHCGRCQLGPKLVCRDGPVFAWPELRALSQVRGL